MFWTEQKKWQVHFTPKQKKKKICWLLSFFFPLFFFFHKLILPGFYIILRETPAIVELLLTYRHPLHQLLNLPVLRKKAFWFNSYIDYTGISTRQPKEKKKKKKKKIQDKESLSAIIRARHLHFWVLRNIHFFYHLFARQQIFTSTYTY